jgi:hypothetical protein
MLHLQRVPWIWFGLFLYLLFALETKAQSSPSSAEHQQRLERFIASFDVKTGRWKGSSPAAEFDAFDYALTQTNHSQISKQLQQALDSGIEYFKVAQFVRLLAEGYAFWSMPEYLITAKKIYSSIQATSEHDQAELVMAVTKLYDVTGEEPFLEQALAKAKELPVSSQNAGEAGLAYMALHKSTADRRWLSRARDRVLAAERNAVRTISTARLANMLFHYTGEISYKNMAESILRGIAAKSSLAKNSFEPDLLLADYEISNAPVHVTIVGGKGDPAAKALYASGLRYPAPYKRIEWWDRSEGPLPNPDVQYPNLPKAAAFACSKTSCSLPVFDPADVKTAIDRLKK